MTEGAILDRMAREVLFVRLTYEQRPGLNKASQS